MKAIVLFIFQTITKVLEILSPKLASAWANKLFFTPRRSAKHSKPRLPQIANLQQHWHQYHNTQGVNNRCKVFSAGNGPVVLLVHGWEGTAFSLSRIAQALLDNGMRVLLFDLPAHGFSSGKQTNLLEISHIIQQLADKEVGDGQLKAIIGHSFGGASAGYAIANGLHTEHFIPISAPTHMDYILDQFCSTIGASDTTRQGIIDKIERILGNSYQTVSLTELVDNFRKKGIKGLIIHDREDQLISYSLAKEWLALWPEAKGVSTTGFGHNRILKSEEVVEAIIDKLREL